MTDYQRVAGWGPQLGHGGLSSISQAWFDKYFPQYGDVAGLDGDKDGKPCEKLLKK